MPKKNFAAVIVMTSSNICQYVGRRVKTVEPNYYEPLPPRYEVFEREHTDLEKAAIVEKKGKVELERDGPDVMAVVNGYIVEGEV